MRTEKIDCSVFLRFLKERTKTVEKLAMRAQKLLFGRTFSETFRTATYRTNQLLL